ncbi:hypothetical protein BDB01DRAFT_769887 [Pilobolus umbonatus]|nr:hypothetical protein BDB01DRAFT_769887 [Pilobolus umbonatus]
MHLNKVFTAIKRQHGSYQYRYLTSSVVSMSNKVNMDIEKVVKEPSLMENAPEWNESLATESEADVKADKEPQVDPPILQEVSAEWVRSHQDEQGNIKTS